ncbi:YggN family protein [Neiella marina]|uniref:YggN family protein n=1 Tax=Neiella holothuriorum TaxID=2870530 RepID=A0ABS7EF06_9GAMM|nr:DUF2884 family protein [Neiella holothuriorum]MBW8190508.1 YggN family protein [Neiella holothuriorum]
MRNILLAASISVLTFGLSGNAMADDDNCSMDLGMGVNLAPNSIELLDQDKPTVTMLNDQLLIDGTPLTLTASQQVVYSEYQQEIRDFVPQVVELAIDAVDLAMVAVQEVVTGLNIDSDGQRELEESIDKLRQALERYFHKDEQNYHLAAHEDGDFDRELEQGIEAVVEDSMQHGLSSVFSMLAEAFSGDEGTFEQRMEAFGERMEKMGQAIEDKVGTSSEAIEQRGVEVCEQAEQLHKLELRVHQEIPQLQDYKLVKI